VIGVDSEFGDQDVHGYLVLREGASLTHADLHDWCNERLAYFKVPTKFLVIDKLPRSATKNDVERHKLPGVAAVRLSEISDRPVRDLADTD
jgi:crotonobetaine/carnitine-CoA ligase